MIEEVKVYISGPVSNRNFEKAREHFRRVAEDLKSYGLITVDPTLIEESSSFEDKEFKGWEDFMREGIRLLVGCDAIYLLEGYEHSRGAKLEKLIAEKLGMYIWYEKHGDFVRGHDNFKEKELLNE
jgi:hypothetical protein